jgi:hypothetical protein
MKIIHRIVLSLFVPLASLSLLIASACGDESAVSSKFDFQEAIQGKWKLTSIIARNKPVDEFYVEGKSWTIKDLEVHIEPGKVGFGPIGGFLTEATIELQPLGQPKDFGRWGRFEPEQNTRRFVLRLEHERKRFQFWGLAKIENNHLKLAIRFADRPNYPGNFNTNWPNLHDILVYEFELDEN